MRAHRFEFTHRDDRAGRADGFGWIPYFRERIDYTYDRHRFWTGQDMGDRMPSRVFDEQVACCWIDGQVGIEMRHKMNIDMISHQNAMRIFDYDPFTTLGGKQNCTVGALRDQAADWDVSVVARGITASGTGVMDLVNVSKSSDCTT